jgi:hypothetical protein
VSSYLIEGRVNFAQTFQSQLHSTVVWDILKRSLGLKVMQLNASICGMPSFHRRGTEEWREVRRGVAEVDCDLRCYSAYGELMVITYQHKRRRDSINL